MGTPHKQPKRHDQQGKRLVAGAPVTKGTSRKFNDWLEKTTGMTKDKFLAEVEKAGGSSLQERINARIIGMQSYQDFITPVIEYYNMTHRKGITLQEDLILLEADLVEYRQKKQREDPDWSPVGDKAYQDALQRKADLMKSYNKIRLDWEKLQLLNKDDNKKDMDVISVNDMVIDDE